MLVIAFDLGKLSRVPKFSKLEGERVREGFLGWAEFERILSEINGQWRKNLIELLMPVRAGKAHRDTTLLYLPRPIINDVDWWRVSLSTYRRPISKIQGKKHQHGD
jgi:hypothetical protein